MKCRASKPARPGALITAQRLGAAIGIAVIGTALFGSGSGGSSSGKPMPSLLNTAQWATTANLAFILAGFCFALGLPEP